MEIINNTATVINTFLIPTQISSKVTVAPKKNLKFCFVMVN